MIWTVLLRCAFEQSSRTPIRTTDHNRDNKQFDGSKHDEPSEYRRSECACVGQNDGASGYAATTDGNYISSNRASQSVALTAPPSRMTMLAKYNHMRNIRTAPIIPYSA